MTIPARKRVKPYVPTLIVDYGNDERYEVKGLLASELERIASLTGGDVATRNDLRTALAENSPLAWRALLCIMRKRAGRPHEFRETDVDMDAVEGWYVDATGQEVVVQTGPLVCEEHSATGLDPKCEQCDEHAPTLNEHGHFVWVYVDSQEPIPDPTKAGQSAEPAPSPGTSGAVSGSEPGTNPTGQGATSPASTATS